MRTPPAPVDRKPPRSKPETLLRRDRLFDDATVLIERDHAEPLTLDGVARRLATSRRQLQRVFTEVGRTNFRSHLIQVRMDRAKRLLTASDLPVAEVASRVGYRQPAQFTNAFRRHHGVTPSHFRKIETR